MKRTERIAALNRQITDLKERTRRAEQTLRNRRQRLENAERAKNRKRDTRRKVLTGAAVITAAKTNPQLAKLLDQARNRHLTKPRDRALFDLSPLTAPPPPPRAGDSPNDPIPGWKPKRLDDGSWGARFTGDTSKLPDELVGCRIVVTRASEESWVATVLEVVERSDRHVLVRRTDPPATS